MIVLFRSIILFFFISMLLSEERKDLQSPYRDSFQYNQAGKIGDNPFPTNPMSDRAYKNTSTFKRVFWFRSQNKFVKRNI